VKVLVVNRRARFEYELLERFVAGIELTGSEVKSVRDGRVSLLEGHVAIQGGQAYLVNVHIATYENAGYASHDPLRKRRLLLHKRELHKLVGKVTEKGLTLVPLAIGVEGNWIKVEIALAKGKKLHDKRDTLKQRTIDRETQAAMKDR
jgi:SsrA-binding protein